MVKEPIPIGPGPWGGDGGKPWDDGVYTGVKQIYIMRTDFIGSVQIEYDRSGQSIWSTKHGNGGQITHRVSSGVSTHTSSPNHACSAMQYCFFHENDVMFLIKRTLLHPDQA